MSKQQTLLRQAIVRLSEVETIIDTLKALGDCPQDGDNALLNIAERSNALARRTGKLADLGRIDA